MSFARRFRRKLLEAAMAEIHGSALAAPGLDAPVGIVELRTDGFSALVAPRAAAREELLRLVSDSRLRDLLDTPDAPGTISVFVAEGRSVTHHRLNL